MSLIPPPQWQVNKWVENNTALYLYFWEFKINIYCSVHLHIQSSDPQRDCRENKWLYSFPPGLVDQDQHLVSIVPFKWLIANTWFNAHGFGMGINGCDGQMSTSFRPILMCKYEWTYLIHTLHEADLPFWMQLKNAYSETDEECAFTFVYGFTPIRTAWRHTHQSALYRHIILAKWLSVSIPCWGIGYLSLSQNCAEFGSLFYCWIA